MGVGGGSEAPLAASTPSALSALRGRRTTQLARRVRSTPTQRCCRRHAIQTVVVAICAAALLASNACSAGSASTPAAGSANPSSPVPSGSPTPSQSGDLTLSGNAGTVQLGEGVKLDLLYSGDIAEVASTMVLLNELPAQEPAGFVSQFNIETPFPGTLSAQAAVKVKNGSEVRSNVISVTVADVAATTNATESGVASSPDCGNVTTSTSEVRVTVKAEAISCEDARQVVDTYYNHPPQPPQGSGGFVPIGPWSCISTSGDELAKTGHGGDCTNGGGTISIDAVARAAPTQPGIARTVTANDVRQHRAPSASASDAGGRLASGTEIYVTCQLYAEMVLLPNARAATEDATGVWNQTSTGSYVSDAFVSTLKDVDSKRGHGGLPAWDSEIPVCASGGSAIPQPSPTTSSTYRWEAGKGAPPG